MTQVEHTHPSESYHDLMALCAFRYCLGARSYAVSGCITYLAQHWHELRATTQRQIHTELLYALENDACDPTQWQTLLDATINPVSVVP